MITFFNILNGLYLLVLGGFVGLLALFIGIAPEMQGLTQSIKWGVFGLYLGLSVFLLATSIGLFIRQNWARWVIIALAGFTCLVGVMGMVGLLMIPQDFHTASAGGVNPQIVMVVGIGFMGIFFVVVPLYFMVFYNLKPVKEIFGASADFGQGIPLGIKFIGGLYAFSVIGVVMAVLQPPGQKLQLLGDYLISGWSAKMYMILVCLLQVYIALGFFKLRKIAWNVFLILHSLYIFIGGLNLTLLREDTYRELMSSFAFAGPAISFSAYKAYAAIGLIFTLVLVYYVYKREKFFN